MTRQRMRGTINSQMAQDDALLVVDCFTQDDEHIETGIVSYHVC